MLIMVTSPNHNNRVKISNINSNSNFIYQFNKSYLFVFCLFIYF